MADDALRYFFQKYIQQEDFENTIFIVTGDHAVKEFPFQNDLEKYHVPLIIYSPMLTEKETFTSISTHIDILPSLLSLLQNNFGITTPVNVHWLGKGLNTSQNFETKNISDLGSFAGSNFYRGIWQNHFVYDNRVFTINRNSDLTEVTNSGVIDLLIQKYYNFNLVWDYITLENKIIPY